MSFIKKFRDFFKFNIETPSEIEESVKVNSPVAKKVKYSKKKKVKKHERIKNKPVEYNF